MASRVMSALVSRPCASASTVPRRARAAMVTAAPAPPAPTGDALLPPAVFSAAVAMSKGKASYPVGKTLVLGFTAGALIGIGALLMSHVGGTSPVLAANNPGLCNFLKGAVGLPVGLTAVVLTGAELFTGNVFVMLSGYFEKAVSAADVLKNWAVSYVGNLVGSVFLAVLSFYAQTMAAGPFAATATKIAVAKVSMTLPTLIAKGILCNWLVCLGVWGAMSSKSIVGKVFAIWLPISTFITLGFEHSVANMFLIPQGMLAGAPVTWGQMMVNNIIPVTIGNVIGAAIFVAGVHAYAYGTKEH